jgi:flagellar FliJ protein
MDTTNLAMLVELARTARDAALTRSAQLQQQLTQARQRLDVLRQYARDYERRAQGTLAQGCDLAAQSNLRAFAAKLAQAIEVQQADVAQREQQIAHALREAQAAERKLASLQTLGQRQHEAQALVTQRREQKATDDLAQRARSAQDHPLTLTGW